MDTLEEKGSGQETGKKEEKLKRKDLQRPMMTVCHTPRSVLSCGGWRWEGSPENLERRQMEHERKSTHLGVRKPGGEFELCCLLAHWPWLHYPTSLMFLFMSTKGTKCTHNQIAKSLYMGYTIRLAWFKITELEYTSKI